MPHSSCPPHQQDEQERKNSGHRSFITRRRVGEVERGRDKSCAVTVESSDAPGVGARGGRRRHRIGEPPGLRGWSVWLLMLRRCGLAPEDCRCEGMLGSGGRAPRSGVRTGRTPDLGCGQSPGPEDAGCVSGMLPGGSSARRHSPAAALAPPGLGTHLASSSSGVSGHLAAKWAVTALDAVAVRAPSRASHSATERRSSRSRSPFAALARAMARHAEGSARRDATPRHATVGSSRCSAAHFRWGELQTVTPRPRACACVPSEVQGRDTGSAGRTPGLPRGCSESPPPRLGDPGLPYQAITSWSCPRPARQGSWMRARVRVTWAGSRSESRPRK